MAAGICLAAVLLVALSPFVVVLLSVAGILPRDLWRVSMHDEVERGFAAEGVFVVAGAADLGVAESAVSIGETGRTPLW
jgi:uncharacterized BrkB/YihY/UPF0761 family membrane protein